MHGSRIAANFQAGLPFALTRRNPAIHSDLTKHPRSHRFRTPRKDRWPLCNLDQLLLLARGGAGQWRFSFEIVVAGDLLKKLQTVISLLAESKGV